MSKVRSRFHIWQEQIMAVAEALAEYSRSQMHENTKINIFHYLGQVQDRENMSTHRGSVTHRSSLRP